MLEYSHGEIGWDVFTLEYKVDAPIDTVLDPDSMIKYQKLFSHLWKMRRVAGALSAGWMRIAGGSRTFLRLPGKSPPRFFWDGACALMVVVVRPRVRLAPNPYCHGGDDSLHPADAGVLPARGDRVLVEDSD